MIDWITGILTATPFIIGAIIVGVLAMAILLEYEFEGWATTIFSVVTALLLFNYRWDIWDFISSNTTITIGFLIFYVVAGIVWSIVKWRTYIGKHVDNFKIFRDDFIRRVGPITDNWKAWANHLSSHRVEYRDSNNIPYLDFDSSDTPETIIGKVIPKGINKKSLIVSWISYWPVSFAATLLNNPFRKFFEWIYECLAGVYDRITAGKTKELL